MLLALLIAANWIQAVEADSLRNRPGNARVIIQEYSRERGEILVGERPIASSKETNDELKFLRRYSNGPLYAPATGYYSFIYGATGIERAENEILAGTHSKLFVDRVAGLLTGETPKGGSVTLTLNAAAQRAADRGLKELSGEARGSVVALNPKTGAILAMVSRPSYDPNQLSSHDGEAIRKAFNKLNADPSKPMLNRAISETYPPGSTFKIVTSAAAIESGQFSPDSQLPGPAQLDLPQTTSNLPNFDNQQCNSGSDTTTLTNALRRSCNTTFGALGLKLGDDALREQAEKFGFNREDIQVPMRVATSVFPQDLNPPQTAQAAIGQFDVRATPLQMAMVVAGIANQGSVMQPYLVEDIRAPDLSVLESTRPVELDRAVSASTAAQITQMMVTVVEEGTGTNAQISGVKVAGKTGTAQVSGGKSPHAWFVSFAPADDPQVAVAVIVENGAEQAEVSGNKLAAPIAKQVMEAVLDR
jgi:peptidoglycan glycosyltransferase